MAFTLFGYPKYLFQTVQNFLYNHITIKTWGHSVLYFSVSKQGLRNSLYLRCLTVESAYIEMEYVNNVLTKDYRSNDTSVWGKSWSLCIFISCVEI